MGLNLGSAADTTYWRSDKPASSPLLQAGKKSERENFEFPKNRPVEERTRERARERERERERERDRERKTQRDSKPLNPLTRYTYV